MLCTAHNLLELASGDPMPTPKTMAQRFLDLQPRSLRGQAPSRLDELLAWIWRPRLPQSISWDHAMLTMGVRRCGSSHPPAEARAEASRSRKHGSAECSVWRWLSGAEIIFLDLCISACKASPLRLHSRRCHQIPRGSTWHWPAVRRADSFSSEP